MQSREEGLVVSSSGKERRRARDTESTSSSASSHSSAPLLDLCGYLDTVINTRSTYLIYEVGSEERIGSEAVCLWLLGL